MAGVNMEGDSGIEVKITSAPDIDPDGAGPRAPIVASAHLTDGPRAEGIAYPENPGMGVDGIGYPPETDMGEANNPLKA